MKIRNGFVSNSSSSSFIIKGYKFNISNKLELEFDTEVAFYKDLQSLEDKNKNFITASDCDDSTTAIYIGVGISTYNDDGTFDEVYNISEFKLTDEVKSSIEDFTMKYKPFITKTKEGCFVGSQYS